MKTFRLSGDGFPGEAITACLDALHAPGGVVAIPTETVYGLAGRWDDASAQARIRRMKGREPEKPFQMLVPDLASAVTAGVTDSPALRALVAHFCPGPLTIVQVAADAGGTVGFRIPGHAPTLALLRELRQPLAATSANRSGDPAAATLGEALANLAGPPDVAIDGGRIPGTALASTVVDIASVPWRLLREGPITARQIRDALAGTAVEDPRP